MVLSHHVFTQSCHMVLVILLLVGFDLDFNCDVQQPFKIKSFSSNSHQYNKKTKFLFQVTYRFYFLYFIFLKSNAKNVVHITVINETYDNSIVLYFSIKVNQTQIQTGKALYYRTDKSLILQPRVRFSIRCSTKNVDLAFIKYFIKVLNRSVNLRGLRHCC